MAYHYLRYAIVCPHLQLFNHKIKGTLSFKTKLGGIGTSGR